MEWWASGKVGKLHLLSGELIEEHVLVGKRGGDCISGFSQQHRVRTLAPGPNFAPWSPCLEISLGCLPCPSQWYTSSLGEAQPSDGCGRGQRSEQKLSLSPQEAPLPPHRNPTYGETSLWGPVQAQGSGVVYQGCSEHILFFKRTMFVNFMYTGKLLKTYLIL